MDGDNQWQSMSISLRDYYSLCIACGRSGNILATLCHERERALFLGTPVSSHIRMCKMIIPDRFNMNNVDQLAEDARTNDFRYVFAVRRISHDCGPFV